MKERTAMTQASRNSRISGFHRKSPQERLKIVADFAGLDSAITESLANTGSLDLELADHMIENAIGTMSIPLGIATNMKVDGEISGPDGDRGSPPSSPPSAIPPGNATTSEASSPPRPAS